MPEVDQYDEIAGSRNQLKEIIGCCVDIFSYPFGNLSSDTVNIVEAAGFKGALTIDENTVEVGANPFQLGRFGVGDWTRKILRQRLDAFFGA